MSTVGFPAASLARRGPRTDGPGRPAEAHGRADGSPPHTQQGSSAAGQRRACTAEPAQAGGGACCAGRGRPRGRGRNAYGHGGMRVDGDGGVGRRRMLWDGRRGRTDDPFMEEFAGYFAGERKTNGKWSNGDGFDKRDTLRCRERRDLPCGGDGLRRNATVSPENLADEFAGNLAVENFGVRSAGLRVAARKTGCTFGISASSPTPAYIYMSRVRRFWKSEIF